MKKNLPANQGDAARKDRQRFPCSKPNNAQPVEKADAGKSRPQAPVPAPHSPPQSLEGSTAPLSIWEGDSEHSSLLCHAGMGLSACNPLLCSLYSPRGISAISVGWIPRIPGLWGAGSGVPGGILPRSGLSSTRERSSRNFAALLMEQEQELAITVMHCHSRIA